MEQECRSHYDHLIGCNAPAAIIFLGLERQIMSVGTFQIGGRKFRVISEKEYQSLRAAMRAQEREAREDARDAAIARRRLKDPKRKTIPLSQLKAELGL